MSAPYKSEHPLTYNPHQGGSITSEVSVAFQHPEDVLKWRQRQFRAFGFVDYTADLLAGTRIDLHHMKNLLDKGCPHDLAMSILIGTTAYGDDPQWIGRDTYEQPEAADAAEHESVGATTEA